MISRFTLDSATEFLFGKDVCSLSAGLVYPPKSPLSKNATLDNHPANQFAHAFIEAQLATAYRGRFGQNWRLFEFWSDRVQKYMHVCHEFIDPILKEALAKKNALKEAGLIPEKNEKEREVLEGETLLDHLVNYTEGECFSQVTIVVCTFIISPDLTVIRDEILNIMIAGRDTVNIPWVNRTLHIQTNEFPSAIDCRNTDICRLDVVGTPQRAPEASRGDSNRSWQFKKSYIGRLARHEISEGSH